jgi:MarR family transcriptional regulator for hemolysin
VHRCWRCAADGPLRQKELAHALLETSSLVRVLDQLRGMGLVDWDSDPNDRRTKCIALTPRGRKTVARILTRSLEIERSILVDVTPEELVVLRSALEKSPAVLTPYDAVQPLRWPAWHGKQGASCC